MVSLFSNQNAKNPNKVSQSMIHFNSLSRNNNFVFDQALGQHEFLKRIKKTLYYGPSNPNRMISQPLAQHVISEFNESHRNYDLNFLDHQSLSKFRDQTPCSLILSMIYLERLIKSDPTYVRLITPSELFLVTLVRLNEL